VLDASGWAFAFDDASNNADRPAAHQSRLTTNMLRILP